MSEAADLSKVPEWADATKAVAGDVLGPFTLMAEAEHTVDEDGYAVISGRVRLRVKDNNTDTFILDQEFDPVFGEGFTTLDHDFWKMQAEAAIEAAGYDLQEVFEAARGNAA